MRLLEILAREEVIAERRRRIKLLKPNFDPDMTPLEAKHRRQSYRRSRVDVMRSYAETNACRRRHILTYFSDEPQFEYCGQHDNDIQRDVEQRIEIGARQSTKGSFALGDQVRHNRWGKGVVQESVADSIVVLFEQVGYEKLAIEAVEERGILEKCP